MSLTLDTAMGYLQLRDHGFCFGFAAFYHGVAMVYLLESNDLCDLADLEPSASWSGSSSCLGIPILC